MKNTWKIWGGVIRGQGMGAVCGLDECKGKWVEEGLILLVVIAHLRGWKWDAGFGDKWVESVVEQERKKMEEAKGNDEVQVMEKGEVFVDEEDGVDEEKRELMVRDGVMSDTEEKEELLMETEDEGLVEEAKA